MDFTYRLWDTVFPLILKLLTWCILKLAADSGSQF